MIKHAIFLLTVAVLGGSQLAQAQNDTLVCYAIFAKKGYDATASGNYKEALDYFEAARLCPDRRKTEIEALIEQSKFRLDSALRAATIQARVNEITSQAFNYAEINPTLAVRLADEACRLSGNGSELAVRVRRQLLEKKGIGFYNSNLECGCKVIAVEVSPDSRYVAIGCSDPAEVKLYDRTTGALTLIGRHGGKSFLEGPTMALHILFDPRGKRLLTASNDGTANLWDLQSPAFELLRTFRHDGAVGGIAFSPGGDSILLAADKTVFFWHALDGQNFQLLRLYEMPDVVRGLRFSPDGASAACGLKNFSARIWQLADGNIFTELRGHTQTVSSVRFSRDGSLLLTGSADHTAKLWDVRSGTELLPYEGHAGQISAINFSADGAYIMTGSQDHTVRLWDRNGACRLTLQGSGDFPGAAAFAPDNTFIVTGDYARQVRFWPLDFAALADNLPHLSYITALAVTPGADGILTGSTDHTAKIWDLKTAQVRWTFQTEDEVAAADWSKNGERFILGLWNGTIHVFDRNGTLRATFQRQHFSSVMAIALSPDGKRYISGGRDGVAKIWALSEDNQATLLGSLEHAKEVGAVAWSPDGRLVATGSRDGTVKIAPWNRLQAIQTLHLESPLYDIRFSPNSRHLLICGAGGLVGTLTLGDKKMRRLDVPEPGNITAGEFSSSGDTLFIGSASGWVRLWIRNKESWDAAAKVFTGRISKIRRVGTDRFVLTGTEGRARLSAYDFTPLQIYRGHLAAINHGAITSDGQGFVTTGADHTIMQWALDNHDWKTLQCQTDITAFRSLPPDGKKFLIGSSSGLLRQFDAGGIGDPVDIARFPASITAVDCSADGSLLLAGDSLGNVRVYDGRRHNLLRSRAFPGALAARLSPDARYAVVCTSVPKGDTLSYIYLWDWQNDTLAKGAANFGNVHAVAFAPDGQYVASGDDNGLIKLWHISKGHLILAKVCSNEKDPALALSFSPNGKYLLSVDANYVARLWDGTAGGEAEYCLFQYELERDRIVDAGFLSDDSLVVFGQRLGGVILRNPLEMLENEGSDIARLSFSQHVEFRIDYDTSACLSASDATELLDCARYFAVRYQQTTDDNDFRKSDLLFERLLTRTPDDTLALVAALTLYERKIYIQNEYEYDQIVLLSEKRARIAWQLSLLNPDSKVYPARLYLAYLDYSQYLIYTADFARAAEYAQAGLALESGRPALQGIITKKLFADLLLANTETAFLEVRKAYQQRVNDPWADYRFKTFRDVVEHDFQELLLIQPALADWQKRNIERIRKEVLEVH